MSTERLDKILSHEGFGTRKGIRRLLRVSEVCVNGQRITDAGFGVNPDKDEISIDGEVISVVKNHYLMMNKIQGVVSANKDGLHGTVFDYLDDMYRTPYFEENLHLIGRLDIDTEGLLIFTTDGKLIHRVTSPKTHFPKSYFVRLEKEESESRRAEITGAFEKGIRIPAEDNDDEADCKPGRLEWLNGMEAVLTITEGKYHQVKRMFRAVENSVVYLKRISIGSIKLDESLAPGQYRALTDEEIEALLSCQN